MAYRVGNIEVALRQMTPGSFVLPKGFRTTEGARAFQAATIWERDVKIPTRDGTILRADIFRPVESDTAKIPVILAWSPYGKSGTGFFDLDSIPGYAGIPKSMLSGLQSFEAPDPAEWVQHGYAVVNVNARGILGSEGDHRWHGAAEGRDGYDAIEFVASLPWTNGRVALMGNSWLATAQWFIAAERPPHLSCMLPLEGLSDVYRETLCRGGVPNKPFWTFLMRNLFGNNSQEDVISMIEKYPLMNEYWADKRARAHLINVPAYVLASMSTGLHTVGSLRCFEDIPHEKKWLRLHPTQEWHDLYQAEAIADFKKFLDFHTKGVQNDWQQTPRARVSVLRFNQSPLVNLPFPAWPIPETQYQSLHLSTDSQLVADCGIVKSGSVTYQGDAPAFQADADTEEVQFRFTFKERTTIIGPSKLTVWMSCPDHDDFDVFVQLRKVSSSGEMLQALTIPLRQLGFATQEEVETINCLKYLGPTGVLRASHRELDPALSKPHWPAHVHTRRRVVPADEIVELEIGLWTAAMQFEADEQLVLKIAGHAMTLAEFVPLRGQFIAENRGRQRVHWGGKFNSHLQIPVVRV
ncbi:Alpha/Beta hydrolase protein [Aspergillus californicus]